MADRVSDLWSELARSGGGFPFRPDSADSLPEPARRLLLRSIAPGTPLARSVELHMHGEIRLGTGRDPVDMQAEQILAPPEGFIWRARVGRGPSRIRGFDRYARGAGELRWKLWGLVPVMRATGEEVTRSAAGRLAMEAILLPSALLPERGVEWEPVDDARARYAMTVGGERVVTTVEVDPEGRPVRAEAMRWLGATEPGGGRYAPFGVELTGELATGGYTIPAHVEAGWRLGRPDEFRFFRATLVRARFR